MTLPGDVTVTQLEVGAAHIFPSIESGVITGAVGALRVRLRNANGNVLFNERVDLELTQAEQDALVLRIGARVNALLAETGWTLYVE